MAIEETAYIECEEAVFVHIVLMKAIGEIRYGVASRDLVQSALARPSPSRDLRKRRLDSTSGDALFRTYQNHPWQGGNKRTATVLMNEFLKRNG